MRLVLENLAPSILCEKVINHIGSSSTQTQLEYVKLQQQPQIPAKTLLSTK